VDSNAGVEEDFANVSVLGRHDDMLEPIVRREKGSGSNNVPETPEIVRKNPLRWIEEDLVQAAVSRYCDGVLELILWSEVAAYRTYSGPSDG